MYYADYTIPNGVSVMYGTVRNYFYDMSKENEDVSLNKKIIGGLPAISGHRISVSLIVHCLRDDMSLDEISEDYRVDKQKIIGALDYVVNLLDKPYGEEG